MADQKPNDSRGVSRCGGGYEIVSDVAVIREWTELHGSHSLAVLLELNAGELLVVKNTGAMGFFRWGKGVIAVGGALTASTDHMPTVAAFLAWCEQQKLTARFVHFPPATAQALAQLGFKLDQLGASYSLSFKGGTLPGKGYQQVRRKLNKAVREGVTVERISNYDQYLSLRPTLQEINTQWLRQKGTKHISLLVSDFERIQPNDDTWIYTAWHRGEVIAYLVFSRTRGEGAGWFHNLSRRKVGCVDGTMQLIVSTFMTDAGEGLLHFGFTPLVDLKAPEYPHSGVARWIANHLSRLGGVVYPARSQRQYKISWCPDQICPEYFSYRGNTLISMLWLLRATNSI